MIVDKWCKHEIFFSGGSLLPGHTVPGFSNLLLRLGASLLKHGNLGVLEAHTYSHNHKAIVAGQKYLCIYLSIAFKVFESRPGKRIGCSQKETTLVLLFLLLSSIRCCKVHSFAGMRIRHFFPRIRIRLSWKNIPDPTPDPT